MLNVLPLSIVVATLLKEFDLANSGYHGQILFNEVKTEHMIG